jgi:outer membrane lipoprotein-sorting protein
MKLFRLSLLVVAGCCLVRSESLFAQEVPPPFTMDKQYSADITVTTKDGTTIQGKLYIDGDKIRNESTMNGMNVITIIRKDQQKIYAVMTAQKTVMEMPYDPDKFKGRMDTSFGPDGKFELIGPETIEGVATTKYRVTSDKTKQVTFFWLDLAKKVPVKMASEDGSFTVIYKNYRVAPQDASLFVPPPDYQVMPMPDIPGMSGGGEGGGGGGGQ